MSRDKVQKEALDAIIPRCSLAISMGVGKTRIGLKKAAEYNNVLVVAPKTSIFNSWEREKDEIGSNVELTFTTYLSLKKQAKDYDLVILDECHSLLYTHKEWLESYKGDILGLTGTPPKYSNSEKGEMVGLFCPVVYEYVVDDAVNDSILNDYKIFVHKLSLSTNRDILIKTRNGKEFHTSEQANYNYNCKRLDDAVAMRDIQFLRIARMRALMQYETKFKYLEGLLKGVEDKTIVFCNTTEQADRMLPHSYHSKNKASADNLVKFQEGEINMLSCVLALNEGINVPNLKRGYVMHSYSNERKTAQRLGRLLRLNPDETAEAHLLVYKNTVDEKWAEEALSSFDSSKIYVHE